MVKFFDWKSIDDLGLFSWFPTAFSGLEIGPALPPGPSPVNRL
jgi:hypothetical protein